MIDITLYELGPTRSARVRWALLEASLPFQSVEQGIDIFKSEALKQIHPLGKLPAAIINGEPLFESAAIITAIADLVPEKALIAKPGTWARNLHYQWVCFTLSELEPFVQSTEINTIDFIIPKSQHVPDIIPQNASIFRKAAAALETHFKKHNYLVDNRFSVTDIFAGYTLNWGQEQGLIEEFPHIQAYLERLMAREHCTLVRH
jgi:glutathione S-transferase